MRIRPAKLADIPAIARIYAHAVEHGTASFELTPPDQAEMARRMTALLDGGTYHDDAHSPSPIRVPSASE